MNFELVYIVHEFLILKDFNKRLISTLCFKEFEDCVSYVKHWLESMERISEHGIKALENWKFSRTPDEHLAYDARLDDGFYRIQVEVKQVL